jgi:hypothetical protein
MTTLVGSVREVETSTQSSSTVVSSMAAMAVQSRVIELWPPTVVALGLGLSVAWTASLFWLLYLIV